MNKFERVLLLRHLELNTELSVLIESANDLRAEAAFLARLDRYSVRTFRREAYEVGEPHFPIVSKAEFESSCLPLLEQGYSLMVAEPVDPADALLAGAILRDGEKFVVEAAVGPGTVRRVTHQGLIDIRLEARRPSEAANPWIQQALDELLAAEDRWRPQVDLRDVLYEFSVYRVPIGWRRERVIFWEIRGLDGHDAELDRFYRESAR